jgi:surfactin synthase thioesterase subunit
MPTVSPWFTRDLDEATDPDGRLTLAFAPPGHGANYWNRLDPVVPGRTLVGVRPPGRENRFSDPVVTDRAALVAGAAEALLAVAPTRLTGVEVIGTCFGAKLALALAGALAGREPRLDVRVQLVQPNLTCPAAPPDWLALSDADLRRALKERSTAPSSVLDQDALFAVFAPMLRADFHMAHTEPAPALPEGLASARVLIDERTADEVLPGVREALGDDPEVVLTDVAAVDLVSGTPAAGPALDLLLAPAGS